MQVGRLKFAHSRNPLRFKPFHIQFAPSTRHPGSPVRLSKEEDTAQDTYYKCAITNYTLNIPNIVKSIYVKHTPTSVWGHR